MSDPGPPSPSGAAGSIGTQAGGRDPRGHPGDPAAGNPPALLLALHRIAAALSHPAQVGRLLRTVTAESAALFGAGAAYLAMPEAVHGVLRVRVGVGALASEEGEPLPLEGSLEGMALRSGEILAVRDLASDERVYRARERQLPEGEAMAIPLLSSGESRAVLLLASLSDRGADADERASLARELAGLLGAVIENAERFAIVRSPDERLEQWREMTHLRERLVHYRRATELLRAVAFGWDPARERFSWDDALPRVFGYDAEEFGATLERWLDRVQESDRADVARALRDDGVLAAGLHLRFRLVGRDGAAPPVSIRTAPMDAAAGRVSGVLAGEAQAPPGGSPIVDAGVLLRDLQHEINNPLAVIMGQAQLLLAEDPGERTEAQLQQTLQSVYRQGERIADAVRSRLSLLEEIGDAEDAGAAGARARRPGRDPDRADQFHTILESLSHGVLVADAGMALRYANPRMHALLGLEPEALVGRPLEDAFAPAGLAGSLRAQLEQALAGEPSTLEAQLPGRDGGAWVQVISGPLRADAGRVVATVSTFTDITARKQAERKIRETALLDPLTGLPNRAVLVERIANAIARARRHAQHQFAVLFLDLDHLKLVNDSFGHSAGDELLRAVTGRLRACMRPEDTVARVGGDEFAVLLEGIPSSADATRVAQRILEELSEPIRIAGYEISASASVGIALSAPTYESPEQVLGDADTAMYRAKTTGRGRFEIFDRELHRLVTSRLRSEAELREALDNDEFRLHYQPIVALGSRRVVGIEALLRWQHPERGLLPPDQFIALAESSGLILPIGHWGLSRAAHQLRDWKRRFGGRAPRWVAINLSSKQFLQPGLATQVQGVLREAAISPDELRVEIGESTVSQNTDVASSILSELRALGVRVNVDDFGTGLSSLSSLHTLPIESLKIDRSFVSDLRVDDDRLVRTILSVAQGMGASTIAEGISTPEQLGELRRLGCQFGQGFLFSRPLTADGIDELLRHNPDVHAAH